MRRTTADGRWALGGSGLSGSKWKDIDMFILPSLIIVVFAKREWLRNTAWYIWGLGLNQ